jgi:hypothetical protein
MLPPGAAYTRLPREDRTAADMSSMSTWSVTSDPTFTIERVICLCKCLSCFVQVICSFAAERVPFSVRRAACVPNSVRQLRVRARRVCYLCVPYYRYAGHGQASDCTPFQPQRDRLTDAIRVSIGWPARGGVLGASSLLPGHRDSHCVPRPHDGPKGKGVSPS